jgi:putative acetyltransferase
VEIGAGHPLDTDVLALLREHLADMHATSPAESVHALDPEALTDPAISFFTARDDGVLLGCGALFDHGDGTGEVKSMRTVTAARGRGIAAALLEHLIGEARVRGWNALRLETGTEDYFAAARRLYERHGFIERGPFADYRLDPHSTYYERRLDGASPGAS